MMTERAKTAASAGPRREISDDFKYNKKKLKHLKRILHNVTIAQGTLVSGLNEFAKVKGHDVSPDGMLGGLGYIMPIREIKNVLITSIQQLGEVADSLADELTNPKWEAGDDADVKKLLKKKEEVEEDAEETIEEDINPEDVVTSADVVQEEQISKKATNAFANAVKTNLVGFGSIEN
jgi:hypothetical protein